MCLHVEAGAVERAVGRNRAQHLANGLKSALPCRVGALDDQTRRAHAYDQAVPAAVKGSGGFFHHFVGGGRAAGEESRAKPFNRVVGSDIVCRDDHHPAAATGIDPVFRQRYRLRRARTG